MTKLDAKEMNKILTLFAERHFSESELQSIRSKVGDSDQLARECNAIMVAKAQILMEAGKGGRKAGAEPANLRLRATCGRTSGEADQIAVWRGIPPLSPRPFPA